MTPPEALLDTSVLVHALIAKTPSHRKARPYLERARDEEAVTVVSTHALAELFSTITALPTRPQHSPQEAQALIDSACRVLTVIDLEGEDYRHVINRVVALGLSGGAIYDGLHVRAAEKVEARQVVTFNGNDFRRMPPQGSTELVVL